MLQKTRRIHVAENPDWLANVIQLGREVLESNRDLESIRIAKEPESPKNIVAYIDIHRHRHIWCIKLSLNMDTRV